MITTRVNIIENGNSISAQLKPFLSESVLDVRTYELAEEFILARESEMKRPAIYVIDQSLPGLLGMELIKIIRWANKMSPIFVVSTQDDPSVISRALLNGADDFILLPFSADHLAKKIMNAGQRMNHGLPMMAGYGTFLIPEANVVCSDGVKLKLTKNEFRIVEILFRNPQKVYSRSEILDLLGETTNDSRTVDAHVANTRKKLTTLSLNIETVRGRGYRLQYREMETA